MVGGTFSAARDQDLVPFAAQNLLDGADGVVLQANNVAYLIKQFLATLFHLKAPFHQCACGGKGKVFYTYSGPLATTVLGSGQAAGLPAPWGGGVSRAFVRLLLLLCKNPITKSQDVSNTEGENSMKFIPGLELSRMLYEEEIEPIMEKKFHDLKYAAATLGMCSEILGLDDEISMDHEWGPRVTIFLSEKDHTRYFPDIMPVFQELLSTRFKGFDMMWKKPGVDIQNTKETILYHVSVRTVPEVLNFYGGITALPLQDMDWLRISEQHLLEFTSGMVYRDDIGELTKARESLKYYPDNVLRFLLMHQWYTVNRDWFPIGRIGSRGDTLGLRIQSAKVVHHLMRIAFMVSRRYFHYNKWFGTLFKDLPLAPTLEPILLELLEEENWQKVEEKICEATSVLLQQQNRLGITPKITMEAENVDDGRHHMKVDFGGIGRKIAENIQPPLKSLMENQLFWLHEKSLILGNEEAGKWSLLLQK